MTWLRATLCLLVISEAFGYCLSATAPCDQVQCFNGGTCDNDADFYERCTCPTEWTGSLCQLPINYSPPADQSNQGTEFIFAFPENYKKTPIGPTLSILSTTRNTTFVNITIPEIDFNHTTNLKPYSTANVELPISATVSDTLRNSKTVLIKASDDIVVYAVGEQHKASSDGFLALPVPALGLEYRVVGAFAKPRGLYKSQFIVSGTEDNTTVNIHFRYEIMFEGKLLSPHQEMPFILNRLESIMIQSGRDLTATWVRSNKPTSVVSGSRCGFIRTTTMSGRRSCEFMVTQVPPVTSWGRTFTITPLSKAPGVETVVRLLSNENEVHVSLSNKPAGLRIYGPYVYQEFVLPSYSRYPVALIAIKPILVVLYTSFTSCETSKTCTGDGLSGQTVTYVQPMEMFYDRAFFNTEHLPRGLNYSLNVIAQCDVKDTLYLNDLPLRGDIVELSRNGICSFDLELEWKKYFLTTSSNGLFAAHLTGYNNGAAMTFPVGARMGQSQEDGADKETHSTTGKEFVFAFMGSGNAYIHDKGPKVILIADKDVKNYTKVIITTVHFTLNETIPSGQSRIIELPDYMIAISSHRPRPDVAINVTASQPITVYGLNDAYPFSDDPRADGFRVLSTDRLGKEYYTISSYSHGSYSGKRAQFIIIGLEDYTEISIVLADAATIDGELSYGGSTKHVTIHRMQAIYITSNGHQVGSHVIANKPISILAGSDCGAWEAEWPCEHQIEHLVPVTSWGKEFVLPKFPGYKDGSSRLFIQATNDGTELKHYDDTTTYIGSRGLHPFDPTNNETWSSFTSTSPSMVTAMIDHRVLTGCRPSCPVSASSTSAMTIIPPLTPLDGNVAFRHVEIRGSNITYNYATVVSECKNVDLLMLNEKSLRNWRAVDHFADKRYCTVTVQLEEKTVYYLTAATNDVAVSAIAYGFSGEASFAYPLL